MPCAGTTHQPSASQYQAAHRGLAAPACGILLNSVEFMVFGSCAFYVGRRLAGLRPSLFYDGCSAGLLAGAICFTSLANFSSTASRAYRVGDTPLGRAMRPKSAADCSGMMMLTWYRTKGFTCVAPFRTA